MGTIPLSAVADIAFVNGPPMISSDNAMLRGAVLFNVRDRDLGSTVQEAIEKIGHAVTGMPQGYYLEWSGQYENLIRGKQTRSEEHTYELQSLMRNSYAVFCLKKKNNKKNKH